jgi:flagellar FliL protein
VILADDSLNEDLDEDSMEDILDDSLEDISDETFDEKKTPLLKKVTGAIKKGFKTIFGSKKVIIISLVSLVLVICLVVGIWILFLSGGSSEEGQDTQGSMEQSGGDYDDMAPIEEIIFEDIVDLESFEFIRLKAGSTMESLSMNLSLELTDHRFRKQIYTMEDRIREIVIGQVEDMTWLSLRNPEGKIMLKYTLLGRINSIFPDPTIRNIYFTNFIMQ